MKKKECTSQDTKAIPTIRRGPAFPKIGSEIVRELKRALDRAECLPGGCLTQKRFAELIGVPKSTINDWYHSRLASPIKGFLCGLERLSEPERSYVLRRFCRNCFRLNDPCLAHDPQTINALRDLVRQRNGLKFIGGQSDSARTFLITAMGNSAGGEVRATGIDVHHADSFVPVSGVSYLRRACTLAELQAVIRVVWPLVKNSEAQLLILNGIWNADAKVRSEISEIAMRRNVLVADAFGSAAPICTASGIQTTLIQVNWMKEKQRRLHVRIQSRTE